MVCMLRRERSMKNWNDSEDHGFRRILETLMLHFFHVMRTLFSGIIRFRAQAEGDAPTLPLFILALCVTL